MKCLKKKLVAAILCEVMLLAVAAIAAAQQPTKLHRIGFLSGGGNPFSFEAFRQGLQALGYVEGKNIVLEYRSAEGNQDRIPDLVAELLRLKVDLIVSTSPGVRAAKQATQTIPIVMVTQEDPVARGFVASLARPGGNITGITSLSRDLGSKRFSLLRDVVSKPSRIGILWDTSDPTTPAMFNDYKGAAAALKIQIQSLEVQGPTPDLEGAFRAAMKGNVGALIVVRNFLFNRDQKQIAQLAIRHRLPAMYERSDYVEAGGLMSYSSGDADNYRRAAYFVDRILKGAKASDLPVEQPTKFEFVINLKTAKAINLTIPQSVLYRADKVIK